MEKHRQSETSAKTKKEMKLEDNIAMVVRVQAMIRGWFERRKYRVLKSNYQNSVKYFKLEESQETL